MQLSAPTATPPSPSPLPAAGIGIVAFANASANVGFIHAGGELAHLGMVRFVPRDAPAGLAAGEQVHFAVDLLARDDKGYHVAADVTRA